MHVRLTDKQELLDAGKALASRFCAANGLELPEVRESKAAEWPFAACAYFRPTYIAICPPKCAFPGYAGRAWSWPGYVIDRTPYGVVQHELGHFVDWSLSGQKDRYFGNYSKDLRKESGEDAITGYCPNDAEWFAEIFRLFVTNADLLKRLRPKAYKRLCQDVKPTITKPWQEVLAGAPPRTIEMAKKKISCTL